MRVRISVTDDEDSTELGSLYRWLAADDDLRRTARVDWQTQDDPTAMGGLQIIELVLTQGAALGSLAMAFVSWRDMRTRRPSFVVTHGTTTITVHDTDAVDVPALLAALTPTPSADPDATLSPADPPA